ncbi:ATP-binding protein [Marinobacterium sp. YM272]|uniref:sensor histidine kinase n=1 Tax=Marinobacterium sp. YM272 TaxID=3421654 RepID=UPI003D7FDA38
MQLKPLSLPSFPGLLIAGFILVVLPLLGGILGMTYALEKMAFEGRRSVTISAEITLASRQLGEAEITLKRAAGQYLVLGDPALKERLERAHARFVQVLNRLESLPLDIAQAHQIAALARTESALYRRLSEASADAGFDTYSEDFEHLSLATQSLNEGTTGYIREQLVTGMNQTAERIQGGMIYLAGAMVLLSLLLAGVFAWLLGRPVKQLSSAIRQLGQNDLGSEISIHGPRDLERLGDQLNWLRQRLQALEEKKLNFFREVSHELKTPLTNMLEAVSLLRDQVTGPLTEEQSDIVEIMHGSASDLRLRIEDLLRYNEATSEPELKPEWFELGPLISEVKKRFDLTLRNHSLNWSEQLDPIRLHADRGRLSVVLENLTSNAIRFSPEQGTVQIDARAEDQQISIRISDQGPGIPASQREMLFQPFFKGTRQPQGTLKGSGLGLAIASAHIQLMGGSLAVVPTSGPGACFEIRLPRNKETPPRG